MRTRVGSKAQTTFAATNVFLNFPFDANYQPMLLALVSALAAHGLTARSVLEVDTSTHRLDRLLAIISSCGASIHDLSYVALDAGKYPRFNMPFELGMAAALWKQKKPHRPFYILEETQHRFSRTLSDLNGFDPLIHAKNPDTLLLKIHGTFNGPLSPTPSQMRRVLALLKKSIPAIERNYGSLLSATGFGALVVLARTAATQVGKEP